MGKKETRKVVCRDEKKVAKAISVTHKADKMMMAYGIRDWYVNTFKMDECGKDIKDKVKFIDVVNALNKRKDVYKVIGVYSNLVRERIFSELASRLGIDRDDVYAIWLADEIVAA